MGDDLAHASLLSRNRQSTEGTRESGYPTANGIVVEIHNQSNGTGRKCGHIGMISQVTDKALKAHENPEILPQTALLWTSTNPSDGTERECRHVGMISHIYWLYQETDKALKAHESPDILPQTTLL
jgi:hypothetical protein